MKLIEGKAPAPKRLKSNANARLTAVTAINDGSVKTLALECWRITKLIPSCDDRRKQFMLQTSVEKMIAALADSGVTIQDPEGSEVDDGMMLNIAVYNPTDQLKAGQRVVSETLSPHIFINNKRAHIARVIVAVGASSLP